MLCARPCPDWCIYIEGHKEQRPPRREGGRPRSVSVLDRFDIDYALCMYCGICVEVCPFDALFWSPEFEYSEPRIADLLHDKDKLGEWMDDRARARAARAGRRGEGQEVVVAENMVFGIIAAAMAIGAIGVVTHEERRARGAVPRRRARRRRRAVHPARPGVRRLGAGARLHRRGDRAVPVRDHAHARADASRRSRSTTTCAGRARSSRCSWPASSAALLVDTFHADKIDLERAGPHRRRSPNAIFRTYIIPFEVVGVLLLGALIGAVVLARKD